MAAQIPDRPTVLVVDDDLSIRVLTTIILARAGHSPTAVAAPPRALERVAEGGVDVVLTDLQMPGLDGFDLLHALRAMRPAPPAVVMTASADEESTARALALGARAIVRKPFALEELTAPIADVLGRQRLAA